MEDDIGSHIRPERLSQLPAAMRRELKAARLKRGWSQRELGRRVGLPQVHISAIETGRVVPRFDTLVDLVRVLDHDLLLVPRALVPAVQALVRDYRQDRDDEGEQPLYAAHEDDEQQDEEEEQQHEQGRGGGHDAE